MSLSKAAQGHKVKVHYTGKLSSGEVFDSSEGAEPLEFVIGSGQVIPGFEAGVTGMSIGDKSSIVISVENAYGEATPDLIHEMPLSEVPEDMPLQAGMQLELSDNEGNILPVTVMEINDTHVILNGNHPLAGQELHFDLELVEIA
jgi:peptidylprolyl isomerase